MKIVLDNLLFDIQILYFLVIASAPKALDIPPSNLTGTYVT